jgi:nucleoid-associated protein YgaU
VQGVVGAYPAIDLARRGPPATLEPMSRRISFILAACLSLAGYTLAPGQDAGTPAVTNAPESTDVATLQAENAALKKEVSDAAQTIAKLQAQLGQSGGAQPAATTSPAPAPAIPAGPQKALPLDATNVIATPAAPGAPAADAGPSRSYTVVKGDSLWKIAHKMYPGDTKNGVDKIQEANKDAIGGKPLKIGQVLVIPQ